MKMLRWVTLGVTALLASGVVSSVVAGQGRPITVADAIEMTDWAGHRDDTVSVQKDLMVRSADGRRGLVTLETPSLGTNTNVFSVYLFDGDDPNPSRLLLTMSSSSSRPAVKDIRWAADERAFLFIGESPGTLAQVYRFSLADNRLEQLTHASEPIRRFGMSPQGDVLVFVAETPPPGDFFVTANAQTHGVVIDDVNFWSNYLFGPGAQSPASYQVFVQRSGTPAVPVSVAGRASIVESPLVSPDGRYAMVTAYEEQIRPEWRQYEWHSPCDKILAQQLATGSNYQWSFRRYWLVTTAEASATPLIDAPQCDARGEAAWAQDSSAVYLQSARLPLEVADLVERARRRNHLYAVRIAVGDRDIHVIQLDEFRKVALVSQPPPVLQATLEEDVNSPPHLVVHFAGRDADTSNMDLNPQFRALEFGKVIPLTVHTGLGYDVRAGVYLPPDYEPGKRYPLVIQTHGYKSGQFSMDGRSEWSSAFAARPLAASGIVVLQLAENPSDPSQREAQRRGLIERFGTATDAALMKPIWRSIVAASLREVQRRGLVQMDRIGISGFSRMVCAVSDLLTRKRQEYAAAVLVDGVDCGYTQYISYPTFAADFNALNGNQAPFGRRGLQHWLSASPGFSLDKVATPVRLVGLGRFGAYEMWGWFSSLRLLHEPVDFVVLPDADHIIERPRTRALAMEGYVDWFRFWLKGEEEPDPAKAGQYRRWEGLCDMQIARSAGRAAFCVPTGH